jgi:DNA-binding winged helix-turn-helix (wHTH) protein
MTERLGQEIVYHFDEFRLDVARGTLQGLDRTDRPLRPKAFLLLRHLLEHPGRLHERDELFEALWPGIVVTDDSLTQCISDLRRALGDRANHVLKTLPRRGYILIAEVEKRPARPDVVAPAPSSAQAAVAPSTTAHVDPEETRCALVLMDRSRGQHGTGDSTLAEEFVSDLFLYLTRFEGLRVVDAPSGAHAEGYRVRCDVRVSGEQLHCAILLEDAQSGGVVWAEQYNDPFVSRTAWIEALIAPLATRIDWQVATESRRRARQKSLSTLTARELCLLAGDHHQRGTEADTAVAYDLLEQAIALDPNYAAAYAWQSYVVQRGFTYGWGPVKGEIARDQALALARHGVLLSPYSPICLARLAWCLLLCQHEQEAVATVRMALSGTRAAGISVRVTCCDVLAHTGHAKEAVELIERTLELDPYSHPTIYAVLGRSLLMAGEPGAALPALRICASRLPDYAPCYHSLLVAAHATGHGGEARLALTEIRRLQPDWDPHTGKGQWFFLGARDAAHFQAAFDAVQADLDQQQGASVAEVLSFRSRETAKRS